MKLIKKVRSPFLFLVILLCLLSCNNDKKSNFSLPYSNKQNIDDAVKAQNTAFKFDTILNIYDSAFSYYDKARTLYTQEKDSLRTAYPLLRMAQIQALQDDYFGAEATATEALPYIEASDSISYQREVYNVLGICYKKLLNYEKSLDYFHKARSVAKDSISKCILLGNIAGIYKEQKSYKKALNIYSQLLKSDIVNDEKNAGEKARILNNIGETYNSINNPIAIQYLEKAVELRKKIEDIKGLSSTYNQMAFYWKTKDSSLSVIYAKKALQLARRIKNPENQLLALRTLIAVSPLQGVRDISIISQKLQDSISDVRLKNKSEFAQMKYESKSLQENLQEQRALSDKNIARFQIILLIAVLIIISAVFLYIMMGLKHKKEKIQQVYVTETRISKKIHDELANDMFNTMAFVETQDFSIPEQQQKLIQNLDTIYNKTRDISRENNAIDTGENFDEVLKEMFSDYNTPLVSVITVNYDTVNWKAITALKKIAIYRVLQEIMVNMKKHSHASNVVVRFSVTGKNIIIQYTDNGVGIDKNHINYKNGLQNAENRILTISGNISFGTVNEKGLKITIAFPA